MNRNHRHPGHISSSSPFFFQLKKKTKKQMELKAISCGYNIQRDKTAPHPVRYQFYTSAFCISQYATRRNSTTWIYSDCPQFTESLPILQVHWHSKLWQKALPSHAMVMLFFFSLSQKLPHQIFFSSSSLLNKRNILVSSLPVTSVYDMSSLVCVIWSISHDDLHFVWRIKKQHLSKQKAIQWNNTFTKHR